MIKSKIKGKRFGSPTGGGSCDYEPSSDRYCGNCSEEISLGLAPLALYIYIELILQTC